MGDHIFRNMHSSFFWSNISASFRNLLAVPSGKLARFLISSCGHTAEDRVNSLTCLPHVGIFEDGGKNRSRFPRIPTNVPYCKPENLSTDFNSGVLSGNSTLTPRTWPFFSGIRRSPSWRSVTPAPLIRKQWISNPKIEIIFTNSMFQLYSGLCIHSHSTNK